MKQGNYSFLDWTIKLKNKPGAPRFHALWEHRLRKTIFIIPKEKWDNIDFENNTFIEIDLIKTPLMEVAKNDGFIISTACKKPSGTVELQIYRNDPKDYPTPINVDKYDIYNEFPNTLDVDEMVNSADTDIDPNFTSYIEGNIFLIKRAEDDGHWLPSLPDEITVLLKKET